MAPSLASLATTLLLFGVIGVRLCSAITADEAAGLIQIANDFPQLTVPAYNFWNLSNPYSACSGGVSRWNGISCTSPGDNINLIKLGYNSYAGPLSLGFLKLKFLTELNLSGSALNGTIPAEITQMTWLQKLNLANTVVSGQLPDLSAMTSLMELDLTGTSINGTIPEFFPNLPNLRKLALERTQYSGTIPESLGNCRGLTYLSVGSSRLNGTIPNVLAQLPNLSTIIIQDSVVVGTIPNFSQASLTVVSFSSNRLYGQIPIAWGTSANNLQSIQIGTNQINGTLPAALSNLRNLRRLDLSVLLLTGTIPESYGNLINLQALNLGNNMLTGAIPASFSQLVNLTSLSLYSNRLNGTVPDFSGWKLVTYININTNAFTGDFNSMLELPLLESLDVTSNRFTGPLRVNSSAAVSLRYFYAPNNRLAGTIPPTLASLPKLSVFNVARNALTGTIPPQFTSTVSFLLDLSYNSLTGDVPKGFKISVTLTNNSLSYCWVEPNGPGGRFYLDNNPLLCICNMTRSTGSPCANCTIGANLTCTLPPKPNGFPSSVPSRCESGIASTGYCCNTSCNACQSCSTGSCEALPDGPYAACNITCSRLVAGWSNLTCAGYQDDLEGICTAGVCNANISRCSNESRIAAPVFSRTCGSPLCQRDTSSTCLPLSPVSSYPSMSSLCFVNEPGNCTINDCDLGSRCLPRPPPIALPSPVGQGSPGVTNEAIGQAISFAGLLVVSTFATATVLFG